MNSVLIILFAVLDCRVWSTDKAHAWADELIRNSKHPRPWLVELSMGGSIDECVEVVRMAMKEFGVLLPDDIGDLLAGLILMRFDRNEITEVEARSSLVDVVDAYGARGVDPEAVTRMDLVSTTYSEMRETAKQAVRYLCGKQFTATDRSFIEGGGGK